MKIMIVFGPILAVFCFGIFCIIMDIIYPSDDANEILHYEAPRTQRSQIVSDYDEDEEIVDNSYSYTFDDKSDWIGD